MSNRTTLAFTFIGIAEGCLWYVMLHGGPSALSEESSPARAAVLYFATTTLLLGRYCWQGLYTWRCAALVGGIVAIIGYRTISLLPDGIPFGDQGRSWSWFCSSIAIAYIATAFLQAYQNGRADRASTTRFPYAQLFRSSWSNLFIGAVALLFVGLFWGILRLWAGLFSVIGIDFFRNFFSESWFLIIASFGSFGFGLALARENESVIAALRNIAIALGRALLPLISFIAMVFLGTLPFTGLSALWDTGHASSLLLGLLALMVLFCNAMYSNGQASLNIPTWQRRLLSGALLTAPVYAIIAAYSLGLRIDQYGLTPQRVWGAFFTLIGAMYASGYAASLLLRQRAWLQGIEGTNVALSMVAVMLLALLHTPLLDPLRLSAENQVARFLAGKTSLDELDLKTLRFDLGHYGALALNQLESKQDATLNSRITRLRELNYKYQYHGSDDLEERLEFLGSAEKSPAFVEKLRQENVCSVGGRQPEKGRRCMVFAVDLNADGQLEQCLASTIPRRTQLECYSRFDSTRWLHIGSATGFYPEGNSTADTLVDAVRSGKLRRLDTQWDDIEIAGKRFTLIENSAPR